MHFFHAESYGRAWHYARWPEKELATSTPTSTQPPISKMLSPQLDVIPICLVREVAAVWEALGDARERAGSYDGAASAYRKARRLLATDPVAEAELCLKEAWIPERVGRYSEAVRWIRRGLHAIAESLGRRGR